MAINDTPTTFYFVVSTAFYGICSVWLKAEYIDEKIIFDRNSWFDALLSTLAMLLMQSEMMKYHKFEQKDQTKTLKCYTNFGTVLYIYLLCSAP